MKNLARHVVAGGTGLVLALSLGACGQSGSDNTADGNSGVSASDGFKIGILLPGSETSRYATVDRPMIEAKITSLCERCEVLHQHADGDPVKQQQQAERMLADGAKVVILAPVETQASRSIVESAKAKKVPVIAYDRPAQGPVDYFVAFDAHEVGRIQGQTLLDAVGQGGDPKRASVVMLNGATDDPEAAEVKKGAHSVLDGKVTIGKEYDTSDPAAGNARRNMSEAISALTKDKIIGVYAADDTIAGAAIAVMKGEAMGPLPPTTGQDAQLAAVQRVVAGDQYMTVYKPVRPEAEIAAQVAILLAEGRRYTGDTVKRNIGTGDVPSVLLKPVAVIQATVKDTVVKDGLYTAEQICRGDAAAACQDAGLSS